jgi:DNA-binding NarL/FixJ family response regulator
MNKLTLLIVDDHFVVRSGLVASLNLEEDLQVVGEVEEVEGVTELYARLQPTVVIMDLQLGGGSGVDATERLLEAFPEARVLGFSSFVREEEVLRLIRVGARGFVEKSASRGDLIAAIRTVARGDQWLSAELQQWVADQAGRPLITARELEILQRIAGGNANKEIAAQLGIAEDTVKQHVSRILAKLGVNDRAQATAEAIRRGLVSV